VPSIELGGHPENRQDILKPWTRRNLQTTCRKFCKPFKCRTSESEDGKLVKTGFYAVRTSIKKFKELIQLNDKCLSTQRNTRLKQ